MDKRDISHGQKGHLHGQRVICQKQKGNQTQIYGQKGHLHGQKEHFTLTKGPLTWTKYNFSRTKG